MARWFMVVMLISGLIPFEKGFYVPGVAPVEFRVGDPIEVKVCRLVVIACDLLSALVNDNVKRLHVVVHTT